MKQEPPQTRPSRSGIPAVHGGEDVNSSEQPASPVGNQQSGTDTVSSTGLRRPVPLVLDIDDDPMAGIPAELAALVGCYDSDTPGGCG
jgi:hypothetical protein